MPSRILDYLASNPHSTDEEIAAAIGCSRRDVEIELDIMHLEKRVMKSGKRFGPRQKSTWSLTPSVPIIASTNGENHVPAH